MIPIPVVADGHEELRAGNGNLRFGSLNGGLADGSTGGDFVQSDM